MPIAQRVFIVTCACLILLLIFELVRKRRLREEYAWLWLLLGVAVLGVAVAPFHWMRFLSRQIGSETPTALIYFLGFLALILLCLQFSVRLSRMTEQVKNLGQQMALLELELEEARGGEDPTPPEPPAPDREA